MCVCERGPGEAVFAIRFTGKPNVSIKSVYFRCLKDSLFLERIYLDKVFCDEILKDRCMAQIDGVPFYYDSNHLSNKGADVLIKNTNLVR